MGALKDLSELSDDIDQVTDGRGIKMLWQLFATYFFFCKAIARDFVIGSMFVYYQNILRADTNVINNMTTAALAPMGIKTLWGAMSDAIPCLGYHKRFYIVWGVCVATTCVGLLLVMNGGIWGYAKDSEAPVGSTSMVAIVTILFFGFEYGQATVDSLTQARYTEVMKGIEKVKKDGNGAGIVSFVWFLINSCALISSWGNWLLIEGQQKILLMMAFFTGFPMLIPAMMNWISEKPAKSVCSPDCTKLTEHMGIFAMSMVLAFGSLGGAGLLIVLAGLEGDEKLERLTSFLIRAVYFLVLSAIFVMMAFWTLPWKIAAPAFYMFLCSSLRLFFSGTLQAWYIGPNYSKALETWGKLSPENQAHIDVSNFYCIKDGPAFPISMYQFVGSFVGAIAGTIGVFIFQKYIIHWNVRPAFWVTTLFSMVSTMLEIMILERWNHKLFGTDPLLDENRWVDQVFFVVGAQAIEKIIDMLDFMPCNILIGKLCPDNLEATIFAVLAGSQNFGTQLAKIFGSIFVDALGVTFRSVDVLGTDSKPVEEAGWQCPNPAPLAGFGIHISGLSIARITGGIILPAITIPLTFWLLPDRGLSDKFLDETETGTELIEQGGDVRVVRTLPSLGTLPRGMTNVSAATFVSMASLTRSLNYDGTHFL